MTYENKLLLSLVGEISELEKIKYLKANLNLKEILQLHKNHSTSRLYEKYLRFKDYNCAFVDDFFYPIDLIKVAIPPFRIASTKSFPSTFDSHLGILGSSNPSFSFLEEYYKFGIEIAKNNLNLIILNFSGISKIIQKGYLKIKRENYCLLASGFSILDSYPFHPKQTVYLSPFEVDLKPSRESFLQTYEIYGSLLDHLILFQLGKNDDCTKAINRALDCGTNIFVHKSATIKNEKNEVSYSVVEEGCKSINSIKEIYYN
ncbi:MAG: hypothetical protein ACPKMZ_07215 [Pleomorphochaeta sp.]